MQRVYEPENLLEAQMLVDMLAAEGIEAFIQGAHLVGAVGELPVCGLLALLVADEEAARARALIEAYNSALPLDADEPSSYPGVLVC